MFNLSLSLPISTGFFQSQHKCKEEQSIRTSRANRKCPGNAARAMHMEQQSFREFISGLSDREARKLSGACRRREAPKFSAERECPGNAGLAS